MTSQNIDLSSWDFLYIHTKSLPVFTDRYDTLKRKLFLFFVTYYLTNIHATSWRSTIRCYGNLEVRNDSDMSHADIILLYK
jgi:hypothetical protein